MESTAAATEPFINAAGYQPILEPLLREVLNEHFRKRCSSSLVPNFWRKILPDLDAEESLSNLHTALEELRQNLDAISCTSAIVDSLPSGKKDKCAFDSTQQILETMLSISLPEHVYSVILKILKHSIDIWNEDDNDMDTTLEKMEEKTNVSRKELSMDFLDSSNSRSFLEKFSLLVSQLKSLNLLHFFADHAVAEIVQMKVKEYVHQTCSLEFDTFLLDKVIAYLKDKIIGWIKAVLGSSNNGNGTEQWLCQIEYLGFKEFAKLRISELFDILVEYPDSEEALCDLKQCLVKVNLRSFLILSLKSEFELRLLHPGANTADIITQYISSIKALRLLDPSGVILEQVCSPVRRYLLTRDDTVRCIVASLTDDGSNELAEELAAGEPGLVDLNEESDNEEEDFDAWVPDPVDADPTRTSKSRLTSDIISLLVNIYGSCEKFVGEYKNLLADRLIQSTGYDISREVRNLELLKLRFGESNLHDCEVMMKDIADSKRINSHIISQLKKTEGRLAESEKGPQIIAFILSHFFWPTFREEKLKLPEFIERELERYTECYKSLKGLRTLEWRPHLGSVEVELQLADRELSFTVSPIKAAIIYCFQDQSTWTVDALSTALSSTPSAVRKHLSHWVGQGILKEDPNDLFTVIERQSEGIQGCVTGGDMDDEESVMASADDQRESEFQVFWAYIVGMLTSLGKMNFDKIHSMLKMFAASGRECNEAELKLFLDKKVREQHLIVSGGEYQLPK